MLKKNSKGLTLIETLAIIIIIGIISSIAYIVYQKYYTQSELASGRTQAKLIQDEVSKYVADNNNSLPTIKKDDDYIAKPAAIDLKKINTNLKGEIKGSFYIYGPSKDVNFDYPEKYIEKVFSNLSNKNEYLITGTSYINTDKMYTNKVIEYPAFTSYLLQTDGTVIQVIDDKVKKSNQGQNKPTTPVIIPSKSVPYYNTDEITFTASSYSALGEVTFTWENISSTNKYPIGDTIIYVTATDKEGNKSDKGEFKLIIQSSSSINKPPITPVITVTPSKTSYSSDEIVKFTATSTDPEGDAINYIWIGVSATNTYPRGNQTVSVYAVDSYGNISPKASKTLDVTNSSPVIKGVSIDPNPAYVFDNVDFDVSAYDADGDMLSFEWKDVEPSRRYSIGTHTGQVRAKDTMSAYSAWYTFTFEITNRLPSTPTITMTPDKSSDIRSYTKITFVASGSTDPDESSSNLTYEWDNKADYYKVGTHTVKARAVDSNGGKSNWGTISFTVNNTNPTVPTTITMTNETPLYADTPITWGVSGSIDLDGIVPSIDGDYVTYEWVNKQTTYEKGIYTIKVRASDTHGGKSDYLSKNFTVVNKPPTTPVITMIPNSTTDIRTNTKITLSAVSTDVDVTDTLTYEWINKLDYYGKGTQTVQVRAKDTDGAYSAYASITFTVNNTRPSNPTITMTPNANTTSVYANTTVSFAASGSTDIDGDPITYEFSESTSSIVALHTTYARGTRTIYARAKDNDGGISDWVSYTFPIQNSIPTKPTISMSPSSNLYADTAVAWTSSGSIDVDGDTLTYNWVNKKTYYSKGSNTVSVYVTDGNGGVSATNTLTFNVLNSAPSAVNSFSANLPDGYSYGITFNRGTSTDIDNDTLTYEYQVDGGNWSTNNPNNNYSRAYHTVNIRAKDSDGATSSSKSVSFNWHDSYQNYEVVGTYYVDTTYKQQWVNTTYTTTWVSTTYKSVYVPTTYKSIPWCEGTAPGSTEWFSHSPPCEYGSNSTTKEEVDVPGHYETVVDVAGHYETVVDVPGHYTTVVDVPGHYENSYGWVNYPPYWYIT